MLVSRCFISINHISTALLYSGCCYWNIVWLLETERGAITGTGNASPHFFMLFTNLISSLQLPPQLSPFLVMSLEWREGTRPALKGKKPIPSAKATPIFLQENILTKWKCAAMNPRGRASLTSHFLKALDSQCRTQTISRLSNAMGWSNITEEIEFVSNIQESGMLEPESWLEIAAAALYSYD